MKEYLLLFRGGDPNMANRSAEESQKQMQFWIDWMNELGRQGKFVGAQPLTNLGKVITGPGKIVSDGPFMEGKEMIGGYLICKAQTFEEAVEISKSCPILKFDEGIVEVREISEMNP